ncbi:MAG: GGDEF domain-containing protein [Proteobacteria bacterium]|nr:GGDEF domain-containing protein [Pseudomonadota bacterium]
MVAISEAGTPATVRRLEPVGEVTVRDWLRIGLALVLCGTLLASDLALPVEMNEVQLYPLVLLPLFRVQLRYLLPVFTLISIALIVVGYSVAPDPDYWDGLSNRSFSIVMVVMTALALHRLATTERELMLRGFTDPLTGLFNRRTFLEMSSKAEARARRHGKATSLLMIDIDHFKRINDTYGHPAGDQVIKALADTAAKMMRPTDILARYGGEEFVVTLPETDADVATRVAERLRAMLEQLVVPADGREVRFTISVGVATFLTGVPLDQAMARADQALYRAKQGGRNRVEVGALLEPAAQPT